MSIGKPEEVRGNGHGMSFDSPNEQKWAERWDQLFDVLSAGPRREIIISLRDAPLDQRVLLPDAAESPNQSMDSETLAVKLRHHHLPKLADAGYVRWESEPFCVQRGPNFAEAEFIVEKVFESIEEIPDSLLTNCRVLGELAADD